MTYSSNKVIGNPLAPPEPERQPEAWELDEWRRKAVSAMEYKMEENLNGRTKKPQEVVNQRIRNMNLRLNVRLLIPDFQVSADLQSKSKTALQQKLRAFQGVQISACKKMPTDYDDYWKRADNWWNRHKGGWFGDHYLCALLQEVEQHCIMVAVMLFPDGSPSGHKMNSYQNWIFIGCLDEIACAHVSFTRARSQPIIFDQALEKSEGLKKYFQAIVQRYQIPWRTPKVSNKKKPSCAELRKSFRSWIKNILDISWKIFLRSNVQVQTKHENLNEDEKENKVPNMNVNAGAKKRKPKSQKSRPRVHFKRKQKPRNHQICPYMTTSSSENSSAVSMEDSCRNRNRNRNHTKNLKLEFEFSTSSSTNVNPDTQFMSNNPVTQPLPTAASKPVISQSSSCAPQPVNGGASVNPPTGLIIPVTNQPGTETNNLYLQQQNDWQNANVDFDFLNENQFAQQSCMHCQHPPQHQHQHQQKPPQNNTGNYEVVLAVREVSTGQFKGFLPNNPMPLQAQLPFTNMSAVASTTSLDLQLQNLLNANANANANTNTALVNLDPNLGFLSPNFYGYTNQNLLGFPEMLNQQPLPQTQNTTAQQQQQQQPQQQPQPLHNSYSLLPEVVQPELEVQVDSTKQESGNQPRLPFEASPSSSLNSQRYMESTFSALAAQRGFTFGITPPPPPEERAEGMSDSMDNLDSLIFPHNNVRYIRASQRLPNELFLDGYASSSGGGNWASVSNDVSVCGYGYDVSVCNSGSETGELQLRANSPISLEI